MTFDACLSGHQVPLVLLDAAGWPADTEYTVTARAGAVEWVVADGVVPAHGGFTVADARAPLGVPTTYCLRAGGVSESAEVVRACAAADVLTRVDGRGAALGVRQDVDGADWDLRVAAHDVADRYHPAWDASRTAGAPQSVIVVRTTPQQTPALRDLVVAQRPVLLLHNPARPNHGPACDVELVRTVVITRAGQARTGQAGGGRDWQLTVRDVAPWTRRTPVATWGEARALGWRWGSGLTWRQVARAVAAGQTPAQAGV